MSTLKMLKIVYCQYLRREGGRELGGS